MHHHSQVQVTHSGHQVCWPKKSVNVHSFNTLIPWRGVMYVAGTWATLKLPRVYWFSVAALSRTVGIVVS